MEKTLDLRVQKTYESLSKAFLDLIEEKDFEKISVNELCQKAKIRRPTFYKHFLDKYDYLKFFVQSKMEDYFSRAAEQSENQEPKAFFLNLFLVLTEEFPHYQHLRLKVNITPSMLMELEGLRSYFENKLNRQLLGEATVDDFHLAEQELNAQLIIFNLIHLNIWWSENRDKMTKDDILQKAEKLIDSLWGDRS